MTIISSKPTTDGSGNATSQNYFKPNEADKFTESAIIQTQQRSNAATQQRSNAATQQRSNAATQQRSNAATQQRSNAATNITEART